MHVLREIVRVMEVNDALFMCFNNILRKQKTLRNISGNLAGHVIPLRRIHNRVFVRVFLFDFLIVALDQTDDLLIGGVRLPYKGACVAIGDIIFCHIKSTLRHDLTLHKVLNFFDRGSPSHSFTDFGHSSSDLFDLRLVHSIDLADTLVGLGDSIGDFFRVEENFYAAPFDNGHLVTLLLKYNLLG